MTTALTLKKSQEQSRTFRNEFRNLYFYCIDKYGNSSIQALSNALKRDTYFTTYNYYYELGFASTPKRVKMTLCNSE